MDNAATTKVAPEVFEAMLPFFCEEYGNPSSAYAFSGKIAQKVAEARASIAESIGASEKEIFFTGGGSESDNWAIKGVADALKDKAIILSPRRLSILPFLKRLNILRAKASRLTTYQSTTWAASVLMNLGTSSDPTRFLYP